MSTDSLIIVGSTTIFLKMFLIVLYDCSNFSVNFPLCLGRNKENISVGVSLGVLEGVCVVLRIHAHTQMKQFLL